MLLRIYDGHRCHDRVFFLHVHIETARLLASSARIGRECEDTHRRGLPGRHGTQGQTCSGMVRVGIYGMNTITYANPSTPYYTCVYNPTRHDVNESMWLTRIRFVTTSSELSRELSCTDATEIRLGKMLDALGKDIRESH